MRVNADKGLFFCLACQAKGTAVDLIKVMESLHQTGSGGASGEARPSCGGGTPTEGRAEPVSAPRRGARASRREAIRASREEKCLRPPTTEQRLLLEQAATQYQQDLAADAAAQQYLLGRGFGPEVAQQFRLGVVRRP
jgi:hypothetical protein